MKEKLKILDDNKNEIGIADRDEVHKKGYWHETFHCWIVGKHDKIDYIYFQKRSDQKKDFPNLLDITAAGHLMSDETVDDGVREVREELGIDVQFSDLTSLGVIEDSIVTDSFIDREFANVFLYHKDDSDDFTLQVEEVAGIFKSEFADFYDMCLGKKRNIKAEGFEINKIGEKVAVTSNISLKHFVPHKNAYLEKVVRLIANELSK